MNWFLARCNEWMRVRSPDSICALVFFGSVAVAMRQLSCRVLAKRAGATPRTFWTAESRKSGVASARFDSLHNAAFEISGSDVPLSQGFEHAEGEDLGAGEVAELNSCILHPESTITA